MVLQPRWQRYHWSGQGTRHMHQGSIYLGQGNWLIGFFFFSVSNFCDFPLSRGFPDQFFPDCQKHLLSLLGSASVRPLPAVWSRPWSGHTPPSRSPVGGKAPAQRDFWAALALCWARRQEERAAAHPISEGRPVINFLPALKAKQEEVRYEVRKAERACGRDFQEDFTKWIWDASQSLG